MATETSQPAQAAQAIRAGQPGAAAEPAAPTGPRALSLRAKGIIAFALLVVYLVAFGVLIEHERHNLMRMVDELDHVHRSEELLVQINMSVARAILTVNENFVSPDLDAVAIQITTELGAVRAGLEHLPGEPPRVVFLNHALEALADDFARQPSRGVLALARNNLHDLVGELSDITQQARTRKLLLLDNYRATYDRVTLEGMAMALIGMVVLGAATGLFFTRMTWDIHKLETRAREIVRGYRGAPLEVTRGDEIGSLMRAVNTMQSDLRSHERQLELTRQQDFHREKMAAVGSLAAAMAHEINNPISAIAGVAQSIREVRQSHHCPNHGVICQPELILEQAKRVSLITRQIADFIVPQSPEPQLIDLNGLVRRTCNFLGYDYRFRNVEVVTDLDGELPALFTVADQITQVLMNLLINAADAMEDLAGRRPTIRVSTRAAGSFAELRVADNGNGMDTATKQRAFDEFFTTKKAGKGSGIGLALCRSLVEEGGGRIRIDSAPGEGTVVEVILPLGGAVAQAA